MSEMVALETVTGHWPVLVRRLKPGEKVSLAVSQAALEFAEALGQAAQFAFIASIPVGAPAEDCIEIGEVTLVRADWLPVGVLVLARGGMQVIRDEFREWRVAPLAPKIAPLENAGRFWGRGVEDE